MTENNAPVGKPSRTSDEVIAGLEAVRVECLRVMTGDVLAGWSDVPYTDRDSFRTMRGSVKVEFRTETLALLMVEALNLIRRLDGRAADAEDALYVDREERAHRERARHARLRSAANEDENDAVSVPEGSGDGETPGSGGEAVTRPYTPVAGDVCTDRDGDTWTVSRVSDAHGPVLLSGSGYLDKTVTYVVQRWGPLKWENGEVTEGVAEDAGDVVPTPAVNDKCEDRDGHTWTVVDRCQSNGEPLLRQGSGVLSHESLSVVAETWGPLVWENGRVTDKNTTDTDNDAERDR